MANHGCPGLLFGCADAVVVYRGGHHLDAWLAGKHLPVTAGTDGMVRCGGHPLHDRHLALAPQQLHQALGGDACLQAVVVADAGERQ